MRNQTEALAGQVISTSGGATPTRELARTPGFPDAEYYTDSLCTGVRFDTGNLKIAWNVFQAARTAMDAAEFVCQQDILGANTALVCVPLSIAVDVALQVIDNYNFCDDDVDSAEIQGSYLRIGHVHDDVVVIQGSLDDLTVNAIEEDLARRRYYIAEFMLPAAFGGKLEIVRDIVADVITRMEAAGLFIDHAQDYLALGDTYYAEQAWKRAHLAYGMAYRKAVSTKN